MESVSLTELNQRFGLIALQADAALARVTERERMVRAARRRAQKAPSAGALV